MKHFLALPLAALLVSVPLLAVDSPAKKPAASKGDASLKTDQDKILYALGAVMGQKLAAFRLTEAELETIKKGLADSAFHRALKVEMATYGPKIEELAKSRAKAFAAEVKKTQQPFLDRAAAVRGAVRKPSGLVYTELKAGNGPTPKPTDKVKVHYQGTLSDGSIFDSSIQRKEPVTFALNQVIPCWSEGLQLMKVGGKGKLACPADLAYGDGGNMPKIKPGAALFFDVELLEVVK